MTQHEAVAAVRPTVPLGMLDFVGTEYGESAAESIKGAVSIAQAVEAAGATGVTGSRSTTT